MPLSGLRSWQTLERLISLISTPSVRREDLISAITCTCVWLVHKHDFGGIGVETAELCSNFSYDCSSFMETLDLIENMHRHEDMAANPVCA